MRRVLAAPLLAALAGCAGEELLHRLDERQANEVLVALQERGIAATKERDDGADESWRIEVPRADAVRAHRVLSERELPRARAPGLGEVFGGGSMVPTPVEEHARYLHALGGELARTIEAIDGVVEARVHLGLPQPDPLRPGDRSQPRGAVLVKCRAPACGVVRSLEPGIRALVSGAADRLDPAAVSVVFAEATERSPEPAAPARRGSAILLTLAGAAALAGIALAARPLRSRLRRGNAP